MTHIEKVKETHLSKLLHTSCIIKWPFFQALIGDTLSVWECLLVVIKKIKALVSALDCGFLALPEREASSLPATGSWWACYFNSAPIATVSGPINTIKAILYFFSSVIRASCFFGLHCWYKVDLSTVYGTCCTWGQDKIWYPKSLLTDENY